MANKILTVKIDGIGLNATHFTKMKKEDAVKAMEADGILKAQGKDRDWAGKAYETMVTAVAEDKKKEEELAARAAELKKKPAQPLTPATPPTPPNNASPTV